MSSKEMKINIPEKDNTVNHKLKSRKLIIKKRNYNNPVNKIIKKHIRKHKHHNFKKYSQNKKIQEVSIIFITNTAKFAPNVFENYIKQNYKNKELIIGMNGNSIDFEKWLYESKKYPMVRIYHLNQNLTLNKCIDYCIKRSIYNHTLIFKESDFY